MKKKLLHESNYHWRSVFLFGGFCFVYVQHVKHGHWKFGHLMHYGCVFNKVISSEWPHFSGFSLRTQKKQQRDSFRYNKFPSLLRSGWNCCLSWATEIKSFCSKRETQRLLCIHSKWFPFTYLLIWLISLVRAALRNRSFYDLVVLFFTYLIFFFSFLTSFYHFLAFLRKQITIINILE